MRSGKSTPWLKPLPISQAVHWAIDELKATVPIWKKEFFEDGSSWKENEESQRLLKAPVTASLAETTERAAVTVAEGPP